MTQQPPVRPIRFDQYQPPGVYAGLGSRYSHTTDYLREELAAYPVKEGVDPETDMRTLAKAMRDKGWTDAKHFTVVRITVEHIPFSLEDS